MTDPIATGTGTPSTDAGEPKTTDTPVAPGADANAQPNTEPKPDEQKPAEPQVPESYTFTMPEGIELDKAAADEFSAIAKELKLDQPTAQKVADVAAKQAQRQAEAHTKLVASWVEQIKTDPEIGGEKFDENVAVARKAMETFGTPELKDVLNATGLGNHPALVKAFFKAGKAISEDKFVAGSPKGAETDIAKRMFPSMN